MAEEVGVVEVVALPEAAASIGAEDIDRRFLA